MAEEKNIVTKDDLEGLAQMVARGFETTATKKDLERFATKENLERFATKDDLRASAKETQENIIRAIQALDLKYDVDQLKDEVKDLKERIALIEGQLHTTR